MKIQHHSHRRGQDVFMRSGRHYHVFGGMLVGTAQSGEDVFAVAAHWREFLREYGWKERKSPLETSVFVKDQFWILGQACLSLSLVHGDQVGHVLLAFQGLFKHKQTKLGILCVSGGETFNRVKTDLSWLDGVITVPIWLIAVTPFAAYPRKQPSIISSHGAA